jgi:uncharacterized protein (DUF58 family)
MNSLNLDLPIHGADIDSDDLIAARFHARFLDLNAKNRALAHLAGARQTRARGRGVDFDEVRQYVAGDDIRAIDWRVTARSGTAHTKLFHEDREKPILVAVDLRSQMLFGSTHCFKSVLAAHLASTLLWAGLDSGERVGGCVLRDDSVADVRPRHSRNTVLELIGQMARPTNVSAQSSPHAIQAVLEQLLRIARPGSKLFLLTDGSDLLEHEALTLLRHVAARHQMVVLTVNDPLEFELPPPGQYAVTDGKLSAELDVLDEDVRTRYQAQYIDTQLALQSALRERGIPLISLSTSLPPLPILRRFFGA